MTEGYLRWAPRNFSVSRSQCTEQMHSDLESWNTYQPSDFFVIVQYERVTGKPKQPLMLQMRKLRLCQGKQLYPN